MVTRWHQSAFIKQLEQQPADWMLVIGMLLGAGLSAVALFSIGGVIGVLLCLAVLGVAVWLGAGAQPILQETVRTAESEKPAK
jgi:predicted RND superfamily exporter protein